MIQDILIVSAMTMFKRKKNHKFAFKVMPKLVLGRLAQHSHIHVFSYSFTFLASDLSFLQRRLRSVHCHFRPKVKTVIPVEFIDQN
jgi:hypothetical protein